MLRNNVWNNIVSAGRLDGRSVGCGAVCCSEVSVSIQYNNNRTKPVRVFRVFVSTGPNTNGEETVSCAAVLHIGHHKSRRDNGWHFHFPIYLIVIHTKKD